MGLDSTPGARARRAGATCQIARLQGRAAGLTRTAMNAQARSLRERPSSSSMTRTPPIFAAVEAAAGGATAAGAFQADLVTRIDRGLAEGSISPTPCPATPATRKAALGLELMRHGNGLPALEALQAPAPGVPGRGRRTSRCRAPKTNPKRGHQNKTLAFGQRRWIGL